MSEPELLTVCGSCGGTYRGMRRLHLMSDEHFWNRVVRGDGCWVWQGPTNRKGYGIYAQWTAHREAWRRTNGPIPDGMLVCHHCDNPPCVRPVHLFLGTITDNNRDRAAKGRSAKPTHCKKGHPYDYIRSDGWHVCRICVRERTRGYIRPNRRVAS